MEVSYKIWFDTQNIYLQNRNGKTGYLPLEDYKPLLEASDEERNQYKLSPFGIHWAKLDEDLCFDGFIWESTKKDDSVPDGYLTLEELRTESKASLTKILNEHGIH